MADVNLDDLGSLALNGLVGNSAEIARQVAAAQKQLNEYKDKVASLARSGKDDALQAAEDMAHAAKQQLEVTKLRVEKVMSVILEQAKADPSAALE